MLIDERNLREVLGVLAGAASMCWDPPPSGKFDTEAAQKAVDVAMKALRESGE